MLRGNLRMMAVAACLVSGLIPNNLEAKDSASDPKSIEGLWSGSWGGGERNGVIFQPVMAELSIKGDQIEMLSLPNVERLKGTIRVDPAAKQIRLTPTSEPGGSLAKAIVYSYDIQRGELTLTDSDRRTVHFRRHGLAQVPMANAGFEFVAATGINDAGELLVTEFNVLRSGQAGATFFEPWDLKLKTKQATVLVVEEKGMKKITVDEARPLIRPSTPIAVAYRHEERPAPSGNQLYRLWTVMGSPAPDSEVVSRILSRVLRPGTLVFILSADENVPVP